MRGRLHEFDGDLPAVATAYAEAARRATNVAERDHPVRRAARARADSKERKVMNPQEITEEPQDRTGSLVRRHDEYTPQELTGGRS